MQRLGVVEARPINRGVDCFQSEFVDYIIASRFFLRLFRRSLLLHAGRARHRRVCLIVIRVGLCISMRSVKSAVNRRLLSRVPLHVILRNRCRPSSRLRYVLPVSRFERQLVSTLGLQGSIVT